MLGAAGAAAGVTEFVEAELEDAPVALLAVAANVYAVPFVNPVTRHGELLHEIVIGDPPPTGVAVTE